MTIAYTTQLTSEQYELLNSLLPPAKTTGRPRTVNMMLVIQGILYVLVTGCAWRLLPKEYPPYSTVYYYFRQWRDDGTWKKIHGRLVQWVRVIEGRESSPSATSIDSQTVSTAVMVNSSVGYDANKKIKGRKRFTLVDTLGLLVMVRVVAANVPEPRGAKQLLTQVHQEKQRSPRLIKIWADSGFHGEDFMRSIMDTFGFVLEVVARPKDCSRFVLLPKRWTVERTYGWLHW